jgi:hypothetical protein
MAALLAFILVGLFFGSAPWLCAQEPAAEANSQPEPVVTAHLDYQDVSYSFINYGLTVTKRSEPFSKEAVLSRGTIIRGLLQLGGGTSNEMAFVWDRSGSKLYLDLNRNLDLIDDPAGVFSCRRGYGYDSYQTFTNVHLPFKTPAGGGEAVVDLSLYMRGEVSCTAAMHSFWQGKVTLQGEERQVGLIENPFETKPSWQPGNFLLRPWAEHNKPFGFSGGSVDALRFSPKLFVGNHAYQLRWTNEAHGDLVKMQVQFVEEQPKLGELKITGEFVRRVTLEGGPYLVVLDRPGVTARAPVGRYNSTRLCLEKGGTEAYLDAQTQAASGRLSISENAPAVLRAGGPLTNSVSVNRRGKQLSLNYRLVGVGGVYQVANQDRSHPPEFAIYQGEKKIASGRFQYG